MFWCGKCRVNDFGWRVLYYSHFGGGAAAEMVVIAPHVGGRSVYRLFGHQNRVFCHFAGVVRVAVSRIAKRTQLYGVSDWIIDGQSFGFFNFSKG